MLPRVSFLIDGFNVYHSIREALVNGQITRGKWLNYSTFCKSYLGLFGQNATLSNIRYFSALVSNQPEKEHRHRQLIEVMKDQGIQVKLGNFKRKQIICKATCRQTFTSYEEKETDINIALSLINEFQTDTCDIAAIVSGDTDLITAIKEAKSLFPTKKVVILFPYKRYNNHFRRIADQTFKIPGQRYQHFQLPDPITLSDGRIITKPANW